MKNRGRKQGLHVEKPCYLEIYIKENGRVQFIPVTRSTASVIKAFIKNEKGFPGVYCG